MTADTLDDAPIETAAIVFDHSPPGPVLDIVLPVFNEELDLGRCVQQLAEYLNTQMPYSARITIADNASTDATLQIACRLAAAIDDGRRVRVAHLDAKGRGRALKAMWLDSDARVVAYMDVDLSTDLNALLPLIAPLVSGHSDLAIGSRLTRSSRVIRGPKREFISRGYNLLLRTTMGASFSDAQCGFKAVRADVARRLLPMVDDTGWFFDTEMLVIAQRAGLRIAEVPVDWVDDPASKVDIVKTATEDVKGCWRVGRALASGRLPVSDLRDSFGRNDPGPQVTGVPRGMVGQLARFCVVGVASTIAYAMLYLALHSFVGAQPANFLSLLITAVFNTAANRAFTFRVRGRDNAAKHHLQGIAIFVFGWGFTAGSLLVLHIWVPEASKNVELSVLVVANLAATILRFLGFRWVFRASHRTVKEVSA
ncbi:bifunctional glycosyltransferase family 2/GtrA family protein [Williamsia muralis]|uniref:bifunctional glycosyltransferase family 2/GtrA family protein n=1 Tax=Williamsia marianensis TaxID=85044 RepID=UPI000DE68974|nr:bifunctional glycosyltransferase family 2/GtrA family protein [Williamsia marianensis]PVY27385.1 glycosyltransferase involved in cell wall biosynthesis [Williamsia marianensis]